MLVGMLLLTSMQVFSRNIIDENKLRNHVNFLASDALEGRLTGTRGEQLATQYVANIFKQLGLKPAGDNGTYFQSFIFSGSTRHGRNVLARLDPDVPSTGMIILSAHIDHLGLGDKSNSLGSIGRIYAGADDNASGVAAMLEVARAFSTLKSQGKFAGNKSILFAAWSGEEFGILGSTHFVRSYSGEKKLPIRVVINLDMVGHLREKLVIQGTGSSADWPLFLANVAHGSLQIIASKDAYLPTDSTAFYLQHIPVLNFFTGAHANYHTPEDRPETLNYHGIAVIADYLFTFMQELQQRIAPIAWQKIPREKQYIRQHLRIYLGTIPDYSYVNKEGVRLSGVVNDSPAELAHLQRDDIVVELAGKPTPDIYTYTAALNSLTPNKHVPLTIMRNHKKLVLHVLPDYRAD